MKRRIILWAIIGGGCVLRVVAAFHLHAGSDEMHFVTHAIHFLSAGRLVTYDQSSGLWFAFTDLMYRFFGVGPLSSRLAALLFGTLTIPVLYLFAKAFFHERVALLSALLLAVSPFHIQTTMAEMDAMAMFFALGGMLAFVYGVRRRRTAYYAVSGTCLGLAVYTKVYPLLFVPPMVAYYAVYRKRSGSRLDRTSGLSMLAAYLLPVLLFSLPSLAHNYLLYKDKGFVDMQFTRALGLGKDKSAGYYSWEMKPEWKGLVSGERGPRLLVAVDFIRYASPLVFYIGLAGIGTMLIFRKHSKEYLIFAGLANAVILPYMASLLLLPKHYLFLELFIVPAAAFAVVAACAAVGRKTGRDLLPASSVGIALTSLFLLGLPGIPGVYRPHQLHFYGKGYLPQLMEFKEAVQNPNALFVPESRIYRGQIHWVFNGRPYLEGKDFVELFNRRDELPGSSIPVEVYFFECAIGDCGWGGRKISEEGSQFMESLADFFRKNGRMVRTITAPDPGRPYFPFFKNRRSVIHVYVVGIKMKKTLLDIAKKPKRWFQYTIGYGPPGSQFDDYQCAGAVDCVLDRFARGAARLALFLAVWSPFAVFYALYREDRSSEAGRPDSGEGRRDAKGGAGRRGEAVGRRDGGGRRGRIEKPK